MSYARWWDGDVYVVSSTPLTCLCCSLVSPDVAVRNHREDFQGTKVEMLEHLREHRKAGHAVPCDAFRRLKAEIEEEARTGEPASFYLRPIPEGITCE